ncbi:alpha/beta-hydrolase [Meira miltonrushii]|uniref:Alpha/beta-hydrolase n=1 Tax=Meira miltonrushii TaxID=1280837 RepID=A0A316VJV6_9BASI|nr:alpha/beta-hydrolase [Meira miltonrushii]PWN35785.1 alpha/beta-hydrolase [Meira miltonrushii]
MDTLIVDKKIRPAGQANVGLSRDRFWTIQPIRGILFVTLLFELLFVQLPVRTVLYTLLPSITRPHPKWTLKRSLFMSMLRHYAFFRMKLNMKSGLINKNALPAIPEKQGATAVWIEPIHRQTGLKGELKTIFDDGGCTTTRIPGYWFGQNHIGKNGRDARKGEKVILFFHGGGYSQLNGSPSSPPTNNLKITLEAAKRSGKLHAPKRALSVEYRLSSEGYTFPSIFTDALASWIYLVRQLRFEPKNILILGDSAGGNLALALLRYIRDERPLWDELNIPKDSPLADGVILSSPWVDISGSFCNAGPSSSGTLYKDVDYLNLTSLKLASSDLVKGLPVPFIHSPWVSPVNLQRGLDEDVFKGFPRALCIYGGLELFVDEIKAFNHHYQYAHEHLGAGQITVYEEPLSVHDYLAYPITFTEDHIRARDVIKKWL